MNRLHLICNAHLDPVWQWGWEEGAAAAVSTFRVAARLCEEYDGFVFNHNEVILYKWIEEYEPELFRKIQRLVQEDRWHIIGGWYLQPDCNMPSGESFVRQILIGKGYFKEKFGVEPTTAINFDSFGHTRGLVQILKKSGYDSYIVTKPNNKVCSLPEGDFVWVGLDGSEVIVHRLYGGYNSGLGRAAEKVCHWMEEHAGEPWGMLAWGVGNHGGGPSKVDLETLNSLMKATEEFEIIHSTPEAYFRDLRESGTELPKLDIDLNPQEVGCYTSQIRIKQRHRMLENELYQVEKMLSSAVLQERLEYPIQELQAAFCDLMTAEFHDTLPGSTVQHVEEASLRLIDHGLEITSRLKARAFFALASGQEAAKDGEIPILVYNPHPFKLAGIMECEFMLADQNWKEEFTLPVVYQDGKRLPSQPEKEDSNMSLDWRKRVVFSAVLEPSQMNRFDVRLEILPQKPQPQLKAENGRIVFKTRELEVVINCETGLVDEYRVNGVSYLKQDAFQPLVIDDCDDSWAGTHFSFRDICGRFRLMPPGEGTTFSGIQGKTIASVRVIEDGEVRTVIEALLKYGDSYICQRYKLPKRGTEMEVEVRVDWSEKAKFLKLSIPTLLDDAMYIGQTAYGFQALFADGKETVSQKWSAAVSDTQGKTWTCINDGIYGSDFRDGEIRFSLLRSPAYTCADMSQFGVDRPMLPDDRFSPRMDQGERLFRFWFNAGDLGARTEAVDREALAHNERPFALSFFPSGLGVKSQPAVILDDAVVQMTAFKKAEIGNNYVIRLFEPTGKERVTTLQIPLFRVEQEVKLTGFEIKTFILDIQQGAIRETNLLEE